MIEKLLSSEPLDTLYLQSYLPDSIQINQYSREDRILIDEAFHKDTMFFNYFDKDTFYVIP